MAAATTMTRLKRARQSGDHGPATIFEAMSVEDIQMAADILRPIFDRTERQRRLHQPRSLPGAANDTQSTLAEARRLFERATRPNVFIKIPATPAGIPAIEQMIYEGVNINITLIFAAGRPPAGD